MDWQRVKEKVTEEVLRQLKTEGIAVAPAPAAAPAQAGPAPAAASQPGPTPTGAQAPAATVPQAILDLAPALPACNVGDDFRTEVLAVVAGPVTDSVLAAIRKLAESRKVTVVGSATAESLKEMQGCGRLFCEGDETMARRLLQGAQVVVAPVVSTGVAAKVGSLIQDCFPATVLVQAALLGKQVIIAREGMAVPAGVSYAVRRKVEEAANGLRTLGFTITDLEGIQGAARGKGTPTGSVRAGGGYVPAYRPPQPARAKVEFDRTLAKMIDHTLLKPESAQTQVIKLCQEAKEYGFMSVCINSGWVPLCANLLQGSGVKVCTVIGFPLGAASSAAKAAEAADSVKKGATEVDMVMNVGAMKSGQYDVVLEDMKAVRQAVQSRALVKVILETGLLTNEEKVKACELAKQAGLDFVKTSTGFGPGGATVDDIALMRKTVGPNMGVKASGGIRDFDTAMAMVKAGASRIGASASIAIVTKAAPKSGGDKKY